MKTAIVIPARLESTRLPRKLLLNETGKSLLQHTYEAASTSRLADQVIVAVDDQKLVDVVQSFGGQVQMTDPHHQSGTDRVAEVARSLSAYDVIVNVQGDEPDLPGKAIDQAIEILDTHPEADVATLATPIRNRETLNDPSCVKVVFAADGRAMYFSRSPIPCARHWKDRLLDTDPANFYQHVGIYAYRQSFLQRISSLERTGIEKIESLEQLRFLYWGASIFVGVIDHPVLGIDTPEDYAAFVKSRMN